MLDDVFEDVQNWSVALGYWQSQTSLPTLAVDALEIGSRHGGISLWLATQGANVLCTDLDGPTMEARRKHERYGVADRVRYASVDAVAIAHASEFDIVTFKSVLGGVGWEGQKVRQELAMSEIYKALKPGGELWFAENIVGSPLHQLARRYLVPWGCRWRYPTISEMLKFMAPYSSVQYQCFGFLGTFGRNRLQQTVLGKLDRMLVDKLVPASWRYIMIGVAKKTKGKSALTCMPANEGAAE
jgi:SAM-dependent methyltransferase